VHALKIKKIGKEENHQSREDGSLQPHGQRIYKRSRMQKPPVYLKKLKLEEITQKSTKKAIHSTHRIMKI